MCMLIIITSLTITTWSYRVRSFPSRCALACIPLSCVFSMAMFAWCAWCGVCMVLSAIPPPSLMILCCVLARMYGNVASALGFIYQRSVLHVIMSQPLVTRVLYSIGVCKSVSTACARACSACWVLCGVASASYARLYGAREMNAVRVACIRNAASVTVVRVHAGINSAAKSSIAKL